MTDILGMVQKLIQHELNKIRIGELGVVTSVFHHEAEDDDHNYEVNVRLKNSMAGGKPLELRRVPVSAGIIGSAALPNVGDLVLLSFVRGDVGQPIVSARLYNNEERPPLSRPDEVVHRLPLSKANGESVILTMRNIPDEEPPREVLLEMPEKVSFAVSDHRIEARVDQTRITVSQAENDDGQITIESGKSRVVIGQDGNISVESEGGITLSAKGDMALSAPNISLKSDEKLTIEAGTDGSFKTGAATKIESGAPMEIKSGATAKIEASAVMEIKGAMVNLN